MILEDSTSPVGTSDTSIGLKVGGGGKTGSLVGIGGTSGCSSIDDERDAFKEGRSEGAGAGGGARDGRGGVLIEGSHPKEIRNSFSSGSGRGGKGGLVGGEAGPSCEGTLSYVNLSTEPAVT